MKLLILYSLLMSSLSYGVIKKCHHQAKKMFSAKRGGGMDGGGTGGMREEEGAAWFYANKPNGPISVCYKISPTFKANESMVKSAITKSFLTWENYLIGKKIYNGYEDDNGDPAPYPQNLKIATKINFESCTKDTELVFYFGVEDNRVKEIKKGLKNPKGFAFRKYEDIDPIKGTSKGVIWIVNPLDTPDYDDDSMDWSKPNFLQAILNHEIGHVMGAQHADNTIMQEDLSSMFWLASIVPDSTTSQDTIDIMNKYKSYLPKIDHGSELISMSDTIDKKGFIALPNSKDEKDTFKMLFNRLPVGKVTASIKGKNDLKDTALTIKDEKGQKHFKLNQIDVSLTSVSSLNSQFRRVRKVYDSDWDDWDYITDTSIVFGANALAQVTFNTNKKLDTLISMGTGYFGYFEQGQNESYISSRSSFSIHYRGTDKRFRPLFIEEIHDFSDVDEVIVDGDITIGDLLKKRKKASY